MRFLVTRSGSDNTCISYSNAWDRSSLLYGLIHLDKPEEAQRRQFLLMVRVPFESRSSASLPDRERKEQPLMFHCLFQAIQFYEEKIRNEKAPLQIAQYYINLGHWHLLLDDFSKGNYWKGRPAASRCADPIVLCYLLALSAYQAAYALDTKLNQVRQSHSPWNHTIAFDAHDLEHRISVRSRHRLPSLWSRQCVRMAHMDWHPILCSSF